MSPSLSIVIIEDEALIAMAIKRNIELAGHRVDRVFSAGEDAVAYALSTAPQLMLVDGRLSGEIDGIETMRRILEIQPGAAMIFITGYADEQFIERARELNPIACLPKPVDMNELLSLIVDLPA